MLTPLISKTVDFHQYSCLELMIQSIGLISEVERTGIVIFTYLDFERLRNVVVKFIYEWKMLCDKGDVMRAREIYLHGYLFVLVKTI